MRGDRVMLAAVALVALVTLPPFAGLMEARLPTHILGQYLCVVAGGALFGGLIARDHAMPWTAAPALLDTVLTLAFWLLPRWIDASLFDPATRAAKIAALFLLAGMPLGWG